MAKTQSPAAEPVGTTMATTGPTGMATREAAVPDYVRKEMSEGKGPRGFEEMSNSDVTLPRLSLCQAMTPQRKQSNAGYLPNLKEGDFFNSLNGNIYGTKITLIPLFFFKSRILFRDLNEGGGIRCQAPDGKSCQLNNGGICLHGAWGQGGEPPACNEFFNYPSLLFPNMDLIVVSLKATGLKAGKAWNAMMRLRGADIFAGVYDISSATATNAAKQEYFTYVIKNSDQEWATPDQYQFAGDQYAGVYEGIRSGRVKVDTADLDAEQNSGRDEM